MDFYFSKKKTEYHFILHSRIQIGFKYPSVIFLHFGEEVKEEEEKKESDTDGLQKSVDRIIVFTKI